MAFSAFLGPLLIGVGPGAVFFTTFIAKKSFLVLLSFFSCFIYLLSLLVISALFKGFFPLGNTQLNYALYLIVAVIIQEAMRIGVWFMHKHLLAALAVTASQRGRRLTALDRTHLAMAWGTGHAACHLLFFFLAPLPLAAEGGGTFYAPTCAAMSLFLASALNTSAMGIVLLAAMVASLEGAVAKNWAAVASAPALHLTAALITLGNHHEGGCVPVAVALYALGAVAVAVALWVIRLRGRRINGTD